MSGLAILGEWPAGLEHCAATGLHQRLGGPALIHLSGKTEPPVFVSVLLHGNETSGWEAVRRLVGEQRQAGSPLPRSLVLLIGNVEAAAQGVRTLPHQQDFNRIWGGSGTAESALATEVKAALAERDLFGAVDLHNNTGHNPHYSVVTEVNAGNLAMAWLFDDQAVYVEEPDTVLARVFSGICPAVTLELGPIADPRCADRGYDFLNRLLRLEQLPPADAARLRLYRAEARVFIPDDVEFSFAGEGRTTRLVLTGGLEGVNFHELAAGTEFAATALPAEQAISVIDTARDNVTRRYFEAGDGRLRLRRAVIPAMYTTDAAVVRQDCLCYFMTRLSLPRLDHPE